MLPPEIKDRFYRMIMGEISMIDFEQWLYADKELEHILHPDDYLDLISLSFMANGAKYELADLIKKHIDPGELETYKMLRLLQEAKQKNEQLPQTLMAFYDLYCKGYSFLQNLGMVYGLAVEVPLISNTYADSWDDLTTQQQQELLDSFSPRLEQEIDKAIKWIETKKIILTGERDDELHYSYIDLRTEEERKG